MLLLGVNWPSDTSAALIEDGRVLFAVEEERLNRVKHSEAFPSMAIQRCLDEKGIGINEIDRVVTARKPMKALYHKYFINSTRFLPGSYRMFWENRRMFKRYMGFGRHMKKRMGYNGKVEFILHHNGHLAGGFYPSPFKEAAILSMDGMGEAQTMLSAVGRGHRITHVHDLNFPHSLGFYYSAFTHYLGFRTDYDEGKVMGLTSYGDSEKYIDDFRKIVRLRPNGRYELDLSWFAFHRKRDTWISDKVIRRFGPARKHGDPIEKRHEDIAAAMQTAFEEAIVHVSKHLHKVTGMDNLCLSGGVALNCVANGKIVEQTDFKDIYIQPAAGDPGLSIGAPLYYYHHVLGNESVVKDQEHAYLGPEYRDEDFIRTFRKFGLKYKKSKNIAKEAAKDLAQGRIVAWHQGRMEFGPRALGNRSILTAPYPAKMKDILNMRVKHREGFRPFAPSCLEEYREEYFDCPVKSPHMILAFPVKEKYRKKLAAVTHVDNTGRVQSIEKGMNRKYYDLIRSFGDKTGVYCVLNTSFNIKGQPIVCTPEESAECFVKNNMDTLVMGNYIARLPEKGAKNTPTKSSSKKSARGRK